MTSSRNPIIREILRQGRGKPRSHVLAALETGRIESNFSNPHGGDADSEGWRQERRSLYRNPTNIRASVRRFYQEAAALDRGQPSYELAADVQRPAAQYRGRYRTARREALSLYRGGGGVPVLGGGRTARDLPTPESVDITTETTGPRRVFDQHGYQDAMRRMVLARLFANRPQGSVLLRTGVLSTAMPQRSDFVRTVAGRQRIGLATPEAGMPARGRSLSPTGASKSGWAGKISVFGSDPARLKPQLLEFAREVSAVAGEPLRLDSGATHSKYTTTGNISQHYTGDATDIPATGKRLLRLGRAALIAAGMPRKKAMKQMGGLYNVRGRQIIFLTNEGGNHYNHLHIGD